MLIFYHQSITSFSLPLLFELNWPALSLWPLPVVNQYVDILGSVAEGHVELMIIPYVPMNTVSVSLSFSLDFRIS